MLSILKLDSILLTLLSTVIHVSFPPFPFRRKVICSSIVYHKTLHLYYKFPYYEKRTHNLLRCHCHSNLPPLHFRCLPLRLTIFLPLYTTVIRYFAILYKVCKLITKYLPVLVNQAFPPLSVIYFSSTTWKMKNLR